MPIRNCPTIRSRGSGGQNPGRPGQAAGRRRGAWFAPVPRRPHGARVTSSNLIGVHHIESQGRRIPVLLFRNGPGSVAGRCLIDRDDTPIVDGPSEEAVLELLAGVIDALLLARRAIAFRSAAWRGVGGPPRRQR